MPYLEDGTRPDLIINPHAIPSRMTIGQIVESLLGIACVSYGGYGDCTAFQVKGTNYSVYGPMLTKAGFNNTGNHLLYNGMTGEQIQANIYMGPTYYMRLKHMVKDKINYRARGPNQQLTRQPVQGRANDGGLRVGEMERDAICAHGLAYFLNESFLVRGDEYYMAICNKTGAIAIYNEEKNLFISPYADGPIKFNTNTDGSMNIKNLTRFGRSFSLLRIPYSFKLLIQELQVMNINMKIITDENVDQLLSMSYSNNIAKLLNKKEDRTTDNINNIISEYKQKILNINRNARQEQNRNYKQEENISIPSPVTEHDINEISLQPISPDNPPGLSPDYTPPSPDNPPPSPDYTPPSLEYAPGSTPEYPPGSAPGYVPGSTPGSSPEYAPGSTPEAPSILKNNSADSILDVPKKELEEKSEEESKKTSNDSGDKKVIELSP